MLGLGRDKALGALVRVTVLVPADGGLVKGRVASVTRRWLTLEECEADGRLLEGRLMVRLPVAFVQVIA